MKSETDIYRDFTGYNSYPIQESERIIRERHMNNFSRCMELINGCEEKVKAGRTTKILEKIISMKKKMSRMKEEFQRKADVLKTADTRISIGNVDEEKLKKIDWGVAESMKKIEDTLSSMTCAETDMFINTKFSDINKYLNDIEIECRERLLVFLKTE